MSKVVVLFSGGIDSTVLLTKCEKEYDEVVALNFSYGSKHNWVERQATRKITGKLGITLVEYDIPTTCLVGNFDPTYCDYHADFLKSDLLESGGEIPEGNHNEENVKSTVVPLRNGIMLMLAAAFAESRKFNAVAIANHGEDRFLYADCRPEFIGAIHEAIVLGTDRVDIYAPFTDMTKAEIVKLGAKIGAPLELTWSCYRGGKKHCGLCSACVERISAFRENGLVDLVEYKIDINWTKGKVTFL